MKKSFHSFLFAAVLSLGSLCAYGAEATAQAIVLSVDGSATVVSAGQNQPTTLKVGDKLPQGATIVTGPNSSASIQTFNGAVALIKSDSTVNLEKLSVTTSGGVVTKQTALLNLKVGSVFSQIDPANHNINDYGIRTPKGVAAARGTEYTVSVTAAGAVSVYVSQSTVVITVNGVDYTVKAGKVLVISPTGEVTQRDPTPAEKNAAKKTDSTTVNSGTNQIIIDVSKSE